jgi:hypothetical protein
VVKFKCIAALLSIAIAASIGCLGATRRPHIVTMDSRWLCDSACVERTDWVTVTLARMQTVRAGMTRAELLVVFASDDAGASLRRESFVSRNSPHFRVDVEFDASNRNDTGGSVATLARDRDLIANISEPYLATPHDPPLHCDSACARHFAWLEQTLERIQALKEGMARRDLLALFRRQGGIRQGLNGTFVSWDCQYVKVDVEFAAARPPRRDRDGRTTWLESEQDRIISVSRPYLGWLIID